MKLELNKRYIDAMGNVTKIIIIKAIDETTIYVDLDYNEYYEDGRFYVSEETDIDLICEVNEYILKRLQNREINNETFIKEHINFWTNQMYIDKYMKG